MITTKKHMYRLLSEGALGNRFRIWTSVEAFERSGYRGLVGVRASDQPGATYWHHLTPHQALAASSLFEEMGLHPVIYEASPDRSIVMQGECVWLDGIFYVRYSRSQTHMRAALSSDNNYAEGRHGEILVRHAVGQRCWSDFVWLSLEYPDHAIEFTAYDRPVGVEQQLAVVWEIRHY